MPHELGSTIKPLVKLGKNPADCWTWLGCATAEGYPKKSGCGEDISAARWLWTMLFGPLPAALKVLHTCGNRGCMNPHHFRAGSQAEAIQSGVGATLTPADVQEIKRAKKARTHATAGVLAQLHGVSAQLIRDVWKGRAWGKPRQRAKRDRARAAA